MDNVLFEIRQEGSKMQVMISPALWGVVSKEKLIELLDSAAAKLGEKAEEVRTSDQKFWGQPELYERNRAANREK